MGRSAEQYKSLLKSLLPVGRALTRSPGALIDQLMAALGVELSRAEQRMLDLVRESRPTKTDELITDFEEELELPDYGLELKSTLAGRRADLMKKVLLIGRQDKAYFIGIAATVGFLITIEEYESSRAGVSSAGDSVDDEYAVFLWKVRVDLEGSKGALGLGFCPESFDSTLANSWDWYTSQKIIYDGLREEILKLKPGHTAVRFDYSGRCFNRGFGWDFFSFPFYDGTIPPGSLDSSFSTDFTVNNSYDGEYLIGGFDRAFDLSHNAHLGESFIKQDFGQGFARPQ